MRKPVVPSPVAICNAKGGDGEADEQFEWDGVVVEGAHDAEFESVDNSDDAFVPSIGFMSMAQSVNSPALTAIGSGGGTSSDFDPLQNAGILHRMSLDTDEMSEDDLLDMGGDPAFLDDEDDDGEGLAEEQDEADFFWDGSVDEDAHLDF